MLSVPVDEDIDGVPLEAEAEAEAPPAPEYKPGFIPSKWESIEPAQVFISFE
ncbi:hypothetical protein JYU34_003171 [Plutella xylostella]|uniref:Uncharacterized protein n=1 Tax=Plutella xylostella TaxID=51655 RepID=A0ABQ7QZD0_PLUXY|nr:hypothetical protein JYU34_003171 [Plutella xylostella]